MPINTDFKTFANSYHKNTGGKYLPKLPNILIMDIIKIATEQTNLDYWSGLGSGVVGNNKTIVDRMKLNNQLRRVFEPIIDGDIEWGDDGLIETNPEVEGAGWSDGNNSLWDLIMEDWMGIMVDNPFVLLIG